MREYVSTCVTSTAARPACERAVGNQCWSVRGLETLATATRRGRRSRPRRSSRAVVQAARTCPHHRHDLPRAHATSQRHEHQGPRNNNKLTTNYPTSKPPPPSGNGARLVSNLLQRHADTSIDSRAVRLACDQSATFVTRSHFTITVPTPHDVVALARTDHRPANFVTS